MTLSESNNVFFVFTILILLDMSNIVLGLGVSVHLFTGLGLANMHKVLGYTHLGSRRVQSIITIEKERA